MPQNYNVEQLLTAAQLANYVSGREHSNVQFPIKQSHAIKLVTRDSKHRPNVSLLSGSK